MMTNLELWRGNFKINHSEIDTLIREIKDSCIPFRNMYTTYELPESKKPEVKYKELYEEIMNKVTYDLGLNHRLGNTFNNYWAQVYGKSARHSMHDHASGVTLFSWVHFLRPTKEKCFCFLDSEYRPYFPQQNPGDFIVFPEWALHCVKSNDTDGDRIVIAGNFNYKNLDRPNGKMTTRNEITQCINNTLVVQQNDIGNVNQWNDPIQWDNPRV